MKPYALLFLLLLTGAIATAQTTIYPGITEPYSGGSGVVNLRRDPATGYYKEKAKGGSERLFYVSPDQIMGIMGNMSFARSAALDPNAQGIYITNSGREGYFKYDATDTTSPDDGAMTIVTNNGHRLKRDPIDGRVHLSHFGAKEDGTTDDTPAINAALAYFANGGYTFPKFSYVLYSQNNVKFDPTAISWPTNGVGNKVPVLWEFSGKLSPTKKWVIDYPLSTRATGGAFGAQFQRNISGIIVPASGVDTTVVMKASGITWQNINIQGTKTALMIDGTDALTYTITLKDCGIQATSTAATANAFIVKNAFWITLDHTAILGNSAAASGAHSVLVQSTPGAPAEAGIIDFINATTAGRGILADAGSMRIGSVTFTNHIHETLPAGEDFFTTSGDVFDVSMLNVSTADDLGGDSFLYNVASCRNFNAPGASGFSRGYRNGPKSGNINITQAADYEKQPTRIPMAPNTTGTVNGELLGGIYTRTYNPAQLALGTNIPVLFPVTSGSMIVTGGQPSLDNKNSGYLIENTATTAGIGTVSRVAGQITPEAGEWIIFGAIAKPYGDTLSGGGIGSGNFMNVYINGAGLTGGTSSGPNAYLVSKSGKHLGAGRIAVYGYAKVATGAGVARDVTIGLSCWAGQKYYIEAPYIRRIPAALALTEPEVLNYLRNSPSLNATAANVTATALPLQLNEVATTSLPTASGSRAVLVYDATRGKIVYGNGSTWKVLADSSGTGSSGVTSVNSLTGAVTNVAVTNSANSFTGNQAITGTVSITGATSITDGPLLLKGNTTSNALRIGSTQFTSGNGNTTSTGLENILIGSSGVATTLTTASNVIAIGTNNQQSNQSGVQNTSVGGSALQNNVSGAGSSAVGYQAGLSVTGSYSTYMGYQAGRNSTGSGNVGFGAQTGRGITTGDYNTFLGFGAGQTLGASSLTNITVIANDQSNNLTTNANQSNVLYMGMNQAVYMGAIPATSSVNSRDKLQVNGTASFSAVYGSGATPTIAAAAGAGTGPTVSVVGTATAGTITILTGTSPAAGSLATITFGTAFSTNAPIIVISRAGDTDLVPKTKSEATTGFVLATPDTPAAATTYKFSYIAIGR